MTELEDEISKMFDKWKKKGYYPFQGWNVVFHDIHKFIISNDEEWRSKIKQILNYRCEGCLADTGGCSCLKDKEKMLKKLLGSSKGGSAVGDDDSGSGLYPLTTSRRKR